MLTKTFALISSSINEYFGADDISKGQEHLHQFSITKLLGKVIDEQVATFRSRNGTPCNKGTHCNGCFVTGCVNNNLYKTNIEYVKHLPSLSPVIGLMVPFSPGLLGKIACGG